MEASHNKMQVWITRRSQPTLLLWSTRYALWKRIEDNDLDDKVKLLLSVHDQQVSECEITLHSGQSHKQS
jgi:hypothetical protein